MWLTLVKFLGGREGEEQRVLSLLGMGFFMGIFLATLQVPAETLITTLGGSILDEAFICGGILGIFSAGAYVFAQRHISFASLAILSATLIMLAMVSLRIAFYYSDYKTTSFMLFVAMGPLVSITTLSFWGIFGRMFDVRASKRIIGGIDTGQLSATCLAFFAISILSDYMSTLDILWVAVLSSVGILVMVARLATIYKLDQQTADTTALPGAAKKEGEAAKTSISYLSLLTNRYFLALSLFLICSVFLIKFNEFTYRHAMFDRYLGNEAALNKAYSLIDAIIIVISFLIQSFLNDYIIGKYGVKISLMIMPILLGLFTVGAIVSGHIFGYEVGSEGYFVFFSFNVMGRIMTASLRDALENPTFKMYFFPIRGTDRFDLQSRIEGVVNEFAALAVGLILMLLGTLLFDTIYFYYVLLVLMALALYFANSLFAHYTDALKKSLKRQGAPQGIAQYKHKHPLQILRYALLNSGGLAGIFSLKLIERLDPIMLRRCLVDALRLPSRALRHFAYNKCMEVSNLENLDEIRRAGAEEKDEKLIELASQTVAYLTRSKAHAPSKEEFFSMLRAADYQKRKYAAQLLAKFPGSSHAPFLMELIQDANPEVRKAAIITAGLLKMPDYWPAVINNLHIPAYTNVCAAALIACGKAAFPTVDMLFYRTGQSPHNMLKIVQILGSLGGPESAERVWKKIDYPSRKIFQACISALSYNNYRTTDTRSLRFKIQISDQIGSITWNWQAMLKLPRKHAIDIMIYDALIEENKKHQDDIFILMAMVFDPQSVQLVKENVEFDTSESLGYAVELMNVFLDEELKPKVFALFDDVRLEDRVNKLNKHYVPEFFFDHEDTLLQIINRDYNRMGRWTKALAIYRLATLSSATISADLIANIFNPDMFLLQATAFTLYKKDKNAYRRQTLRLSNDLAKQLDRSVLPPVDQPDPKQWNRPLLQVERVIFFKQLPIFAEVDGSVLAELAELATERTYEEGVVIAPKGSVNAPVRFILKGSVKKNFGDQVEGHLGKGHVIGFYSFDPKHEYQYDYTSTTSCTVLEIILDDLFMLAGTQKTLLGVMIRYVQSGGREQQLNKSKKQAQMESISV